MPFDGSGNFQRTFPPNGWVGDAQANIKIKSDRHDQHDNDLAAGLTNCLTRDGQTQPSDNIPMNGHRIVNMADPIADSDAATKKFVNTITGWTTSKTIEGADLNGRLIFSGTGVTGLQWTVADFSWVAKVAEAGKTPHRLVMNDKADATGTDVFGIDDAGRVTSSGVHANNLYYEGGNWRTPTAGTGTIWTATAGYLSAMINDVATAVAYQIATMRQFFAVTGTGGSTIMTLDKKASGNTSLIYGAMAGKVRWQLELGNATPESGTDRVGSDYYLYSYDNAGANPVPEMNINRANHTASFYGPVSVSGILNFGAYLQSTSTTAIFAAAAGGYCYLRPNGYASSAGQFYVDNNGSAYVASILNVYGAASIAGDITIGSAGGLYASRGIRTHTGATSGGYGSSWANIYYATPYVYMYIDNTQIGAIAWQSDYRMKKDIVSLPGMWNIVKALKPIQYSIKQWSIFENDDTPRWGFVAHELQEQLLESAATGHKDEEDVVQSPNHWTVIAALTKALQEAMLRIEALEAGS